MSDHTRVCDPAPAPVMRRTVAVLGGRRLTAWHGLLLVVALALVLRLGGLGSRSFFGDEIYSLQVAEEKTAAELVHHAQYLERHPPLPHLISRVIYLAGAETEFQWRLFAALCGVALAALVYLVALHCDASRLSLPAGLLAAAMPLGVLFSQANRWYPLAGALLALAILCMVIGSRREGIGSWVIAGLALALAFYTVYLAAAVIAVLLLMALVSLLRSGSCLRGWAMAVAVVALCTAPWLPYLLPMLAEGKIHLAPVRTHLPGVGQAALLLQNLAMGPTVMPWNWAVTVPAAVLHVVLLLALVGSDEPQVRRTRAAAVWFMVLCLPIMLVVPAASAPRYWLVLLLPWSVLVVGGLVSLRSPAFRTVMAAGLAALVGYGLVNLYTVRQYQYLELADDWRGLAAQVRLLQQSGDEMWSLAAPLVHYYGPGARYVMGWGWNPEAVQQHLAAHRPQRVILQYSPLSGWEGTPFVRVAERITDQMADAGYRRESEHRWGHDPDVQMKRRYMRGRTFPDYRHAAEVWVRASQ